MQRSVCQFVCLYLLLAGSLAKARVADDAVITMPAGVIDTTEPLTLGLPAAKGVQHNTVFQAVEGKSQYNHGAVLFSFKGALYCQWQTSAQDEDGPDTHVIYSQSSDGTAWQPPKNLAARRDNAIVTSGGWWSDGQTLVAFINVWPDNLTPKAGYAEYALSDDGITWSEFKPVTDVNGQPVNAIIEQDLKSTSVGRIITAFHRQPGLIATPYFTDHPLAFSGWQRSQFTNLPYTGSISRELEPSWFASSAGDLVMTFRDQGSSYRILASRSSDNGESWSIPQITAIPDSRAKQSAGNLPDGSAFIVNNPTGNKTRLPLVISLSQQGKTFDRALRLRGEESLPTMRYPGKYKRTGYSYPKSYVWNNALWVSYAVNKEDIAVTRVPLPVMNYQKR